MRDLGRELQIRVWVDSSAGKAVAGRLGLGRTRHIEVRCLWPKEVVRRRRVEIYGELNPSHALTKPTSLS